MDAFELMECNVAKNGEVVSNYKYSISIELNSRKDWMDAYRKAERKIKEGASQNSGVS